jgi:RNase P/RNase MRP subunit POP5
MSALAEIAPRIARAVAQERRERGITRCWQNHGYHVYMAGPCFDTFEEAVAYRDRLDAKGVRWLPQPRF